MAIYFAQILYCIHFILTAFPLHIIFISTVYRKVRNLKLKSSVLHITFSPSFTYALLMTTTSSRNM